MSATGLFLFVLGLSAGWAIAYFQVNHYLQKRIPRLIDEVLKARRNKLVDGAITETIQGQASDGYLVQFTAIRK